MILKRTLFLFPILLTGMNSISANEGSSSGGNEVNPYDCTVEEVQIFMMKKTESTRVDSAIATWEDFKKSAVPVTTAASGGYPANSPENSAVGGVTEEETCPMFFTDAQLSDLDIDLDISSFSIDNLVGLLNGELSGLADSAKDGLENLSDSLIGELEKGICERLSSEYIGGLINDKINEGIQSGTGFGLDEINSQDFINNLISKSLNEALDGSLGIYNIFDSRFVDNATNLLNSELDRQTKELDNFISN